MVSEESDLLKLMCTLDRCVDGTVTREAIALAYVGHEPSAANRTSFCPFLRDWSISSENHFPNSVFSLLLVSINQKLPSSSSLGHPSLSNATITDNPKWNCYLIILFFSFGFFWIVVIYTDIFWYCVPALIATDMW